MSKSIHKLVLKYNDKSWNKTLRGDDWEKHYGDTIKLVTKRTEKEIDTGCHMTVGNGVVSSSDTFKFLITGSTQSPTDVIILVCNVPFYLRKGALLQLTVNQVVLQFVSL